jgi:hypothetical protein
MADAPRIVYVHGAGRQEERGILKRRLDQHLFGANQLDRTVLAYYSDLLHDEPPAPAAIQGAASPDALAIEATFLARADVVAAAEGAQEPVPIAGISLPDPAFRLLAGIASGDVIAYLFGDRASIIQDRVLASLPAGPLIVIAHSLGTIVAYDVLSRLVGREVRLFVTVGSPLGIGNVQRRIGDRTGPPAAIPACVMTWQNFADPFDPVALERTLADEFRPANTIRDKSVENRALLNHDLTGYLDTKPVRAAVRSALE